MKALGIVRDIVVIVGVALLCYVVLDWRIVQEQDRAARLSRTLQQIGQLEEVYKTVVFNSDENKGIYQQIFRQNEIAIEYQKLLLLRDLTVANASSITLAKPTSGPAIPPPPK